MARRATKKGGGSKKPLSQLSPAYRGRIEGYAKKRGITVAAARKQMQAVRGHKVPRGQTEAALRRSKEKARQEAGIVGLTTAQRQTIRRHYIRISEHMRMGKEAGQAVWEKYKAQHERAGWDAYKEFRKAIAERGELDDDGDIDAEERMSASEWLDLLEETSGISIDVRDFWAAAYRKGVPRGMVA